MDNNEIEYDVWLNALKRYENQVEARGHGLRVTNESVLDYAKRSMQEQEELIKKLEYAQVRLRTILSNMDTSL